ncbi:hypothetical protein R3P38DRAFT_2767003 [Favolaschia claudopus]|uniref:NmrA-like domain-containing protein n=1 Tax=Favolaschia claudopus TaxID=2862362 RepID=A0AAW0CU44_9AGAR
MTVTSDKYKIEQYLKASGVPHAMVLTGWFLENLWNLGSLVKTDTGYDIPMAAWEAHDKQTATWISHDLGQSVVALLNQYKDPSKGILGSSYPVVSYRFTYAEFTAAISKAIKQPVTFTTLETSGSPELDESFAFSSKIGMYNNILAPNPDLVALGVKFATMDEFLQKEVVPRFA